MCFKIRKIFAIVRLGAGHNSPVAGLVCFGKKITPTNRLVIDNTEWIQFSYKKRFVWVDVNCLRII